MKMLRTLADNNNPASLANRLRRKRMEQFRRFIAAMPKPVRVLDVGGTERFWINSGLSNAGEVSVVILNASREEVTLPNFESVEGDARNLSQFEDGAFEVVFSNSVIEHVGDFAAQTRMAREIQRVGKRYFVQAPAKSFPIEPHFLFPFFAYLPHPVQAQLVTRFSLGWYPRLPSLQEAEIFLQWFRLPTYDDMRRLFPSSHICTERLWGMTKSYVACGPQSAVPVTSTATLDDDDRAEQNIPPLAR